MTTFEEIDRHFCGGTIISTTKPLFVSDEDWQAYCDEKTRRYNLYVEESTKRYAKEKIERLAREQAQRDDLASFIGQPLAAVELVADDYAETSVNTCRLTFADGRMVTLTGWGYDSWGISVEVSA